MTLEKQLGFEYKSLLSNMEDYYTMLKGQTHQKCAVIVNIYAPDIRARKMQRREQQSWKEGGTDADSSREVPSTEDAMLRKTIARKKINIATMVMIIEV